MKELDMPGPYSRQDLDLLDKIVALPLEYEEGREDVGGLLSVLPPHLEPARRYFSNYIKYTRYRDQSEHNESAIAKLERQKKKTKETKEGAAPDKQISQLREANKKLK